MTPIEVPLALGTTAAELQVELLDSQGMPPTNVINVAHEWQVKFGIDFSGPLFDFIHDDLGVKLQLALNVNIESIGPGPEVAAPNPMTATFMGKVAGKWRYEGTVTVPAGTLATATATPYHVIAVVNLMQNGNPGPIAGFADLEILLSYMP